jgi:L-amino acid N-acyltransferase YncA
MEIRKAQIKDLKNIDEVYKEGIIDEEKSSSPRKSKREILKELNKSKKDRLKGFSKAIRSSKEKVLVYEKNGRIVGFGVAVLKGRKRGAELALIYLRKTCRKKGIGSRIVKELMKWLKEKGEKEVFVTMDVANKASINLHKKVGFKESILFMKRKL